MNPTAIFKLLSAKKQFSANHPKFMAFVKKILTGGSSEVGTVIEVTVTRPGQEPITGNMKVVESDLEVFESLKGLLGSGELQE